MDESTGDHVMEDTSADEQDSVSLSSDVDPCLEAIRIYGPT